MRWSPFLLLLAACSTPRNVRVPATYDDGLVWVTLLPPARDHWIFTGSLPALIENRTAVGLDVFVKVRLLDESGAALGEGIQMVENLGPREARRTEITFWKAEGISGVEWGDVIVRGAEVDPDRPEPRFTTPR